MLPTFKELNSDYNPADVRTRLKAVVEELGKPVPDGVLHVGMGTGALSKRYVALTNDIKKRADHTGLHGLKHNLSLHGGDVAEEVLLFFVEQATLLAQLDASVHARMDTLAGGDPSAPDKEGELLKVENEAAKSAVGKIGPAVRAAAEAMFSASPPAAPAGQPSATDLMFFSSLAYKYLDKALWHTVRARKARRVIDAYKKANGGKMPMRNCSDAGIAAYLLQTYFHHFHKAQVYASPMIALVEFCTHWVAEWRKAWAGNNVAAAPGKPAVEDKAALCNLMEVYETISTVRATHKTWDCVAKGGICYGPKEDPKKQQEPFKEMGFTDGSAKFKPLVVAQPWFPDMTIWTLDKVIALSKAWESAGDAVNNFFRKAGIATGSFYQETLKPLFDDESILEEPDARVDKSARDAEDVEEVLRETRLQFERFSFWVMAEAGSYDWKADETFIKRKMRRMVAASHDDEKHEVQPPWGKIFKTTPDKARLARMMYDVYGLVEAKDLSKNAKNAWKKFWAPKKKGEMAVTLLFLAGGIAISIGTMGAGLPVMALVGIAAAKKVAKKAALKGVKAANSSLNSKALKGNDTDPNTQLTLSATEAREGAASLARHFVSSFKNLQRMLEIKKKHEGNAGKRFFYEGCSAAAGYAYAAHAFDHHFTKTQARLQNLTAMADAVLGTLEEGDAFFGGEAFSKQMKEIHDLVTQPRTWHVEKCDGRTNAPPVLRATRSPPRPVYISQNLPSCICYGPNYYNQSNREGDNVAPYAPQRGLFFMDYNKAKNAGFPPFDMLEHWVNARDVVLASIKEQLKAEVTAEKGKVAPTLAVADQAAVTAALGASGDADAA